MDYKKRYNEALEQAKKELKTCGDLQCDAARQIFRFFPELKENEKVERIRKAIGTAICGTTAISILEANGTNLSDALSYLEKQKDEAKRQFDLGVQAGREETLYEIEKQKERPNDSKDAHGCSWRGFLRNSPHDKDTNIEDIAQIYVEGVKECNATPDWNLLHTAVIFGFQQGRQQKEQNTPPTEETELNSIAFLEQLGYTCVPPGAEQEPVDDKAFEEWIDDWWKHNKVNNPDSYDKGDEIQFDEKGFKNFCRGIRNMCQQKPVYDELKRHQDELHNFCAGIPSYFNEKKPEEWSEEDKKTIHDNSYWIREYAGYLLSKNRTKAEMLYGLANKLESLRPQPHWKPSEDQMKALKQIVEQFKPDYELESLYNDLKKL